MKYIIVVLSFLMGIMLSQAVSCTLCGADQLCRVIA